MSFNKFLNEDTQFKVGNRVTITSDSEGYEDEILKTKGKVGVIKKVIPKPTYSDHYWVGVEFNEKVHKYKETGTDIPYKKGIEYVWWIKSTDLKKLSTSKYVKQLQFEAVEPDQYIEEDIIVVKISTVGESKELQEWAFKHGFLWTSGKRSYNPAPISEYKLGESSIAFIFKEMELNYTSYSWFKSSEAKKHFETNSFGFYENINEFFNVIKNDSRIKKEK